MNLKLTKFYNCVIVSKLTEHKKIINFQTIKNIKKPKKFLKPNKYSKKYDKVKIELA